MSKKTIRHKVHGTGREVRITEDVIGEATVWNVETRFPNSQVKSMRHWHCGTESLWLPTLADADCDLAKRWQWWDQIGEGFAIPVADSLYDDLTSAMESLDTDVENGGYDGDSGMVEWLNAYKYAERAGRTWRVHLHTRGGLVAMSEDIRYRWEFNAPKSRNPYGVEDPRPSVHRAAEKTLQVLDSLLVEV